MRLLGLLKPFAKREQLAFFSFFLLSWMAERAHAYFNPLGIGPKGKPVKRFIQAEVNANDDQ